MKVKKLLAGILSAAMVLGTMAFPASAETATEMTYAEFYAKCTPDANGNIAFDGKTITGTDENLKVIVEPHTVCWLGDKCPGKDSCCANSVEPTDADPTKLDDRANGELIQYRVGKGAKDINISNVDFVYKTAEFCFHKNGNESHNSNFTKIAPQNGQLQTINNGNTTFSNCAFTNMDLSIFGSDNAADMANTTATVTGCTFSDVAYGAGIKWIRTQNTVISGNRFKNCKSGIMVMPAIGIPSAKIENNTFDGITYELVQLGGTADWASAADVVVSGNTAENNGATTSIFRVEAKDAKVTNYNNNTIADDIPATGAKSKYGATISNGKLGVQDWSDSTALVKVGDNTYKTLDAALKAVYMSNPGNSTVIIECKAGADVGTYAHAHVADNIIINGNGATAKMDIEVDQYPFSRTTGAQDTTNGVYLDKDITVEINDLNGVSAWGSRNTNHTINLNFNNCKNMGEVMFRSGESKADLGVINVSLNNCSFDADNGSQKSTSIHITSVANITVKNCEFKGIAAPINLNNKSNGIQSLTVEDCTFTKCADEEATKALDSKDDQPSKYAAPIRLVTIKDAGKINANVTGCTFTDCSTVGHGDILLGDGREGKTSTSGVATTIKNTEATVQTEFPGAAEKTKTVDVPAAAEETTITIEDATSYVAKIGDVGYETLGAATAAAKDGDTITIIGKVDVAANDIPKNKTLNFAGQDTTSELVMQHGVSGEASNGYYVDNSKLTFNNLIMTWFNNKDYQGLIRPTSVEYNNCTINGKVFLYGGTETFTKCKFVQDIADYNLWTYGADVANFNSCEFYGLGKSINVYNEYYAYDKEGYTTATPPVVNIKGCTFTASQAVKGKAAVEIGSNFCPFVVNISDSTATGYSESTKSGSMLYNVKAMKTNLSDSTLDKTKVTVDNTEIDLSKIRNLNSVWTHETDSGYFDVEGTKSGVMRFMFKVKLDEEIKTVGIKYINANNIPESLNTTNAVTADSANIKSFQGDITGITEDDATDGSKYCAAAYVVTSSGATIWSEVIECSMNWAQEFTTTDGGAE